MAVHYTLSDEEGKESIHKKKRVIEDSDTEFCDIDEEYSLMGQTGRWLVLNTYTNKIESEFTSHFKFVDKNDSGNERDPRNFIVEPSNAFWGLPYLPNIRGFLLKYCPWFTIWIP